MAFSRDLKDFVAAFQAGYKMIPSKTDEDYKKAMTEYQKALKGKLDREAAAYDPELEKREKLAGIAHKESLAKYYSRPDAGTRTYRGANSPEVLTPEQEAAVGGIGVNVPLDPDVDEFKRGGMVQAVPVKRYAEGGMVEEEEPKPEGPPADMPAAAPGFSFMAASDAVQGAYESLNDEFKLNGAMPGPNDGRAKEAMQKGIGAVDPKQLDEVDQAMGIQQMPEDRRNMARLAGVWQFYQEQGLPNRAKKAAGDLLQTYRMISNRFHAIAKQCAAEGNVDGAVEAGMRAYAYIPDSGTIKCQKTKDGRYQYSYTDDKTGKVVHKALLTPDEILAAVTNHGASSFDDLVMASGNKEEIGKLREDRQEKRAVRAGEAREKRDARQVNRKRMGDTPDYLSKESPAKIESNEMFDELPLGAWFINPSDGKVIKKTKERTAPAGE